MSNLFTLPFVSGIAGDKLYFRITGTSTPQNVYTDEDLTVAHDDPVAALSDGRFPPIYLDPEASDYRVIRKDLNGATYAGYPVDDVPSAQHQSQTYTLKGTSPTLLLHETDAPANEGKWRIRASGGVLLISSRDDADTTGEDILRIVRNGTALETFEINGDPVSLNGSFIATLTGCMTTVTGTVQWFQSGKFVTLYFPSSMSGTGSLTTRTITGLPSALWPQSINSALNVVGFSDNGVIRSDVIMSVASDGTIVLGRASSGFTGGFTGSGATGFQANVPITYLLL